MRLRNGGIIVLIITSLATIAWLWPDLRAKTLKQHRDSAVVFALDWEDVAVFQIDLPKSRATTVVLATDCDPSVESKIRGMGKVVLWRLDDDIRPDPWLKRFHTGDGIFIAGEHVLEHPRLIKELPEAIKSRGGFLALMEFVPGPLTPRLAAQLPNQLIKGHVLPTREILSPNKRLWKARLLRAVHDRWVRLLLIRYSPALTSEENRDFLEEVIRELIARKVGPSFPVGFSRWPVQWDSPARLKLALLLSMAAPLLVLAWAARSDLNPYFVFAISSLVTLTAAVAVHALGSTPDAALGLQQMRGVKLQLLAPLSFGGLVLFSWEEVRSFLEKPLQAKHVIFLCGGFIALIAVYLMRSGNFPLIPVSHGERVFRDVLDQIFIARPRFKEFAIGHPLFLTGLALLKKPNGQFTGRILLWLGIIGQISILNTFSHFHSPLEAGLLRTVHGIWLGSMVAVPGLLLVNSRQ